MTGSEPFLALHGVTKTYDPVVGEPILRGVDLELEAGGSLAILGPSGSGKSTLLNIIGTLEPPTSGTVLFEGRDLAALDEADVARFRNREVGFVFQHHHLLPQCTALENVLVPTLAGNTEEDRGALRERAANLLDRVGLAHRVGHRPSALSGGERQRVAVVRALINEPRLILADEPTGSLDAAAAESLGDLLVELNAEQEVALIVVTHSRALGNRMKSSALLREGRLER